MPNLTWEEISDLKHILIGAVSKMKKGGAFKEAQYTQGVVNMLNDIINTHEKEN